MWDSVFFSRERHKNKKNLYEDSDVMKISKIEEPGSIEFYSMTTILVLSVDKIGVTSWIALSNSSGKLMLRLSPSLFIANSE